MLFTAAWRKDGFQTGCKRAVSPGMDTLTPARGLGPSGCELAVTVRGGLSFCVLGCSQAAACVAEAYSSAGVKASLGKTSCYQYLCGARSKSVRSVRRLWI